MKSLQAPLGRDAVRATAWSLIQNVGGRGLSFLVFIALARLLPATDFGVIALAASIMAVCTVFLEMGCAEALVQRDTVTDEHVNGVFWTTIGISTLLAAGVVVAGGPIARVFSVPALETILPVLAGTLPFTATSIVLAAHLRRQLAFKALAYRTIVVNIASAVVGLGMALMDMGVWSLVGKTVVEAAVGVVVLGLSTPWRPRFGLSRLAMRQLAPFGLNMLGSKVAQLLSSSADKWVIGYFTGTHSLGIYNTAQRVFSFPMDLLPAAANSVLLPTLSRLQSDPARAKRALLEAVRAVALVSCPIFGILVVTMSELVPLVLGASWNEAIVPAQIFCAGGIVFSVNYLLPTVWIAQGRADWFFRFSIVNGVANLAGFVVGVHWGPTGVALAYVLRGVLVSFPMSLYLVRRAVGCSPAEVLSAVALPFAVTLLIIGAVQAVALITPADAPHLVRLLALTATALCAFTAAMGLFARGELTALARKLSTAFPWMRKFLGSQNEIA